VPVIRAAYKKKPPTLPSAIEIILSSVGLIAGLKIAAFVVDGDFSKLLETKVTGLLLELSVEDTIYFLIGGVALMWVSVVAIYHHFTRLR
jgi:hypothetical protein